MVAYAECGARRRLDPFNVSCAGAVFGLFFDSLLGATLEERGLLNNDAVNFLSTAGAAGSRWRCCVRCTEAGKPSPRPLTLALALALAPCFNAMQLPERVAENLVGDALAFLRLFLRGRARSRRSQNIQPIRGANGMNAEHVRVIADDHEAVQAVDARDHDHAARRFLGVAAFGFSNDGAFGNTLLIRYSRPTEPSVY